MLSAEVTKIPQIYTALTQDGRYKKNVKTTRLIGRRR